MKHINIPVFIPHLGCPNQCIFCNQRHISGTVKFEESSVRKTIDDVLSTVGSDVSCEIAFFGGSFTGIDRDLMVRLLDLAQGYVNKGLVCGIRMSTRPDYISKEIVDILKKYTITYVELGVQSMNDDVLRYLKRGHTSSDTVRAARLLKENGFNFVGQMMIGLPTATKEDELYCAKEICRLGAGACRIYPTLVFSQTELEELTLNGEYKPLSLDEAVERCAAVLKVFNENGVDCIRIGLCDSENLHSDDTYVAGPNSPSVGEMVKSRMIYDDLCEAIEIQSGLTAELTGKVLHIECPKGLLSQVIGHKRSNICKLKNKFGFKSIMTIENPTLENKTIKFEIKEENSCV